MKSVGYRSVLFKHLLPHIYQPDSSAGSANSCCKMGAELLPSGSAVPPCDNTGTELDHVKGFFQLEQSSI